jgi:methylglutamate dehydrogenase subunit B
LISHTASPDFIMHIDCPFCGPRDASEFSYLGDTAVRPDPEAPDAPSRFHDAVYLRANPAGPHDELWYHANGCRSWLRVTRDTRTHRMLGAAYAGGPR